MKKQEGSEIKRIMMSDAEVEGLLKKTATALTQEEVDKLRQLVATLKFLTVELEKKNASLGRLRQMLFGSGNEKTQNLRLRNLINQGMQAAEKLDEHAQEEAEGTDDREEPSDKNGEEKSKRPGHGRRSSAEYTGAEHIHVQHQTLKHKDRCPKCLKGKVYLQKQPKILVRLFGGAPIQAKVWSYDWFRCNSCGAIFDAELPKAAGPPEKYDESVTATVGLLRYGFGMPFYRLARLQENVHVPLPAGTQWNLVEASAGYLERVFLALMKEAAKGTLVHNDDTVARVLELIKAQQQAEGEGKKKSNESSRSGVFTTGLISHVGERKVSLFVPSPQLCVKI